MAFSSGYAPLLSAAALGGPGAQELTPSLFSNSNTLNYSHTLTTGPVTLSPSLFTNSNTLNYQHTVTAPGPTQDLTQSARFDNSHSYYTHQANLTLTAALFSSGQSYYQHQIDLALAQSSRFDNAQSYYSHALSIDQFLTQEARFDSSPSFYQHSLTQSAPAQSLIQSARFDQVQSFYGHTVIGPQYVTQDGRFDNAQAFFGHSLSGGSAIEQMPSRRGRRNPMLRPIIDGHAVLRGVRGKSVVGRLHVEGLLRIDNAAVQLAGVTGRGASGHLSGHGECNTEARLQGISCRGVCGKVGVYAETIVFARVDPSLDCEVNPTFRNVGKSFVGTIRAKGVKNPSDEELTMMVIAATRRSPATLRVR